MNKYWYSSLYEWLIAYATRFATLIVTLRTMQPQVISETNSYDASVSKLRIEAVPSWNKYKQRFVLEWIYADWRSNEFQQFFFILSIIYIKQKTDVRFQYMHKATKRASQMANLSKNKSYEHKTTFSNATSVDSYLWSG